MKNVKMFTFRLKNNSDLFFSDKYLLMMLWFYNFWLSVFHIKTSCSALGVKELMLRFEAPVRKRRTTYPRRLCIQRGDITPGKVARPSLFWFSSLLFDPTECLTSALWWGLSISWTLSLIIFDLLASIIIILYYSVLSCFLIPYLVNYFVSPQIVAAVFNYSGSPVSLFQRRRSVDPSALLVMEPGRTSPQTTVSLVLFIFYIIFLSCGSLLQQIVTVEQRLVFKVQW